MMNAVSTLFEVSERGRHRLVAACVLAGALALAVPVGAIGGSTQEGGDSGVTTLGLSVNRPHQSNDSTLGVDFPHSRRTFVKLKYEHPDDVLLIGTDRAATRVLEFGDAERGLPFPNIESVNIGKDQRSVYFSIVSDGLPCEGATELNVAVELVLLIGDRVKTTRVEPLEVGTLVEIGSVELRMTRVEENNGLWSLMLVASSVPLIDEFIVRDIDGRAMELWQSTHIDGTSWSSELRFKGEPAKLELVHWAETRKETRTIQTHVGVGL